MKSSMRDRPSSIVHRPSSIVSTVPYSDTLEGEAIDPEEDPITYAKLSGPDWLQIAEDGELSGNPVAWGSADSAVGIWLDLDSGGWR